MTQILASLCVYCGAATGRIPTFIREARLLGTQMAQKGVRLVYGGARIGMMGTLADAVTSGGGEAIGVIPEFLDSTEVGHRGIADLRIVDTMHARKQTMFDLSDAFAILPGGFGTLDEAFEMLTWRQLRLHDKPVIFVNLEGYWDPLLTMVNHMNAQGFVRDECLGLFSVIDRVDGVFDFLPLPSATASVRTAAR